MDRRTFIRGLFAAALLLGASQLPARAEDDETYALSMYNTHTEEYLRVEFKDARNTTPANMDEVNHFLRCHYTGEVHEIEPGLIGLLARVDMIHGGGNVVHVVSGYRSPEYNAILARRSSSVARHSLHMEGMAVDFRLPGVNIHRLYSSVRSLSAGGAGIYPDFVHMDVGRVRTWGSAV